MSKQTQAFTKMAAAKAAGEAPVIGVGMLGYAFMGKAHSNAYKKLPYMVYPPVAIPRLVAIAGRSEEATAEAQRRYGYERYYTDWHKLVEDHEIQLFDNGGPGDVHAEPTVAAAQAGKHVLCEKPMARTAAEGYEMWQAVAATGVKAMVCHNYRFVPAVRLAYDLISSGKLGRIYHFRAVYLQEWIMPHYDTGQIWRLNKQVAGSGALGDLGSHIIDLARFLCGEVKSLQAMTKTFVPTRYLPDGTPWTVDVDDAFAATFEFENGAIGTMEATRFAAGRKNYNCWEINGERGSIRFDMERMNELEVFWVGEEPAETQGWHRVSVTEGNHPFMSSWWPHGHIIGYEHTFVHAIDHLLNCIVHGNEVGPFGATFEDGYRNAVICDAIVRSADERRTVDLQY